MALVEIFVESPCIKRVQPALPALKELLAQTTYVFKGAVMVTKIIQAIVIRQI